MQFRDLKTQYQTMKAQVDQAVLDVMAASSFISGPQVNELEMKLAQYVGVKHCITCANGTDALTLALMAWNIGPGDAVFVPDFTFFASGEAAAYEGAVPVFVDVEEDTFNLSPDSLEKTIKAVLAEGNLNPRAIIAVDLFGQPADYIKIKEIAGRYGLYLLEDGAQGFGGSIRINGTEQRACSFGDISTTSFFPAKPLGCYGDGGAVFTDNDEWAEIIRSLGIHGKGKDKYDNVRIGINSRLDTIQAAVLQVKLKAFTEYELEAVNRSAQCYEKELGDLVKIPYVPEGYYSSWAQYSVLLKEHKERDELKSFLLKRNIPSMIYYPKPMHRQTAFCADKYRYTELPVSQDVCTRVLALPIHPYLGTEEQSLIIDAVREFYGKNKG